MADSGSTPGAIAARELMARGALSAVEYAETCLARIAASEADIGAFAFLDEAYVREQAKRCDALRQSGQKPGPLHGLPVALKDVIDTEDMPTENGTVLDRGRRPERDAVLVQRLRQAGAIIMGKAVTTELAVFHPGKTKNPHDPARTPGGSSSGSAASVAAGMVPLAIGTQTNGSVIRPASYCGVVGFKPSFGLIPRTGVLMQSESLDTMGVFARGVEDAALIADAITGFDASDRATRPTARPMLYDVCIEEPPLPPNFCFIKTPVWDKAASDTREGFDELVEALGERCDAFDLPQSFAHAWPLHRRLMVAEQSRYYAGYYTKGRDQLSEILRGMIEEGQGVTAADYLAARDARDIYSNGLSEIFERYDAIVTPAAPGEAPLGLEATGDPVFNTLWTFCGMPAITLPLLVGENNMPIGIQLVGRRGDDARLLRTARWLTRNLNEGT